jgi:hypothetical protein
MKPLPVLSLCTKLMLLLTLVFTLLTGQMVLKGIQSFDIIKAEKRNEFQLKVRWIGSEEQRHLALARQVTLLVVDKLRNGLTEQDCRHGITGSSSLDSEFGQFAIAAPDGAVSCNSIPWLATDNVADQDYFQEALKRVEHGFIREVDNHDQNNYAAILTRALRDQNGRVQKVILVAMDFSWVKEEVDTIQLPTNAHLLVIDDTGTVIGGSPNINEWLDKSIAETAFYKRFVVGICG